MNHDYKWQFSDKSIPQCTKNYHLHKYLDNDPIGVKQESLNIKLIVFRTRRNFEKYETRWAYHITGSGLPQASLHFETFEGF